MTMTICFASILIGFLIGLFIFALMLLIWKIDISEVLSEILNWLVNRR